MRNLLLSAFALVCLLPMNAQTVNTRIYPAEKLAKVKAKADTPTYAPAIKTLMKEADKAMNLTPPSVMDKSMTASSGDKHDYMSMGPYWWPDPSKPDGTPRKLMDSGRLFAMGWRPRISLEVGLRAAYADFCTHYL